ncbi:MAG TPA: nitroreductase family protein [Bacteroidales bacterium]|nr:nitroreductase family protein [Bacteroidales bacterium]
MQFEELAKQRYSSRHYQPRPIEREKLKKVLEAARVAPSAANKQPWKFYVFEGHESVLCIAEAYHREWLKDAPIVIVACADHEKSWKRASDGKDHADIDVAIAVDHMTLQATDLGLATCWICNFDPEKCRQILNLPENIEPVVILPLVYPSDQADINRHEKQRKSAKDIIVRQ